MAAGLSVARANFQRFQTIFDAQVRRCLSAEALQGILLSDGELAPKDFELEFAELLRDAGPWGQGFPEPLFDGEFEILNSRIVGERHLKLSLSLPGIRKPIDAIAFNDYRASSTYRLNVIDWIGTDETLILVRTRDARSQAEAFSGRGRR